MSFIVDPRDESLVRTLKNPAIFRLFSARYYLSAMEKLLTSFCLSLINTDVGFCRFQRSGRFFSCDGVLGVPILVDANLLIRLLTVRLTVR